MPGRPPALAALVALAACSAGAGSVRPAPAPPSPAADAAAKTKVRYVHAHVDEGFWVSHGAQRDRVVSGGARLELLPTGEIAAAAWDAELPLRNEPLVGALEVPARLGGGFVAWTRSRVFFSRTFTGPLEPVATGIAGPLSIRGARTALGAVVVITDAGPRELLPGAKRLTPMREPAIYDAAALSATRAARLDVFGRLRVTGDAGARWTDLSPAAGLGVHQLVVGDADLWIDTHTGRFLVTPGGKLEPGDVRTSYDPSRGFQIHWKGARWTQRDDVPWALRETTPLALALVSGAEVGDGTAFGTAQGVVTRVDLATGKLVSMAYDWIPNGLLCQPVRAPDGVLFACVWETSQGYGGYVLRSTGGAPPEVEKTFSDDGAFVVGDDGAIGFLGSCSAEPRYIDPNDQTRYEVGDAPPKPVLCLRRGPGEWNERRVDLAPGATLLAWVPGLDGTAAALVLPGGPLPPPAGAQPAALEDGVRVVNIRQEIPGWAFRRASWQNERGGLSGYVDRRFTLHADGTIDGWLAPADDGNQPVMVGVTLDPNGVPAAHDGAPRMVQTVTGGRFAVAIAKDGELYESTDHGRTWRAAGRSPVPPETGYVWGHWGACSALGCALGTVVRVGWGDGALEPTVSTDPFDDVPSPAPLPRLVCGPRGAPEPLPATPPAPPGARQTVSTGWGETLEIVRDAGIPEPARPGASPPGTSVPVLSPTAAPVASGAPKAGAPGTAKPPAPKGPHASPAVLRTHTLLVRPPFSPTAAARRLNATDAGFSAARRTMVVPLLEPSGEVDVLVGGDQTELLVAGDKITVLPAFEGRRWVYGDGAGFTGLAQPGGRALVLGEMRRRLSLEDHGPGVARPPLYLGLERDQWRRRPMVLATRDDGTTGVLVLDGPAAETAGAVTIDRLRGTASAVVRLAPWSTLTAASDPRCKKGADAESYRALVVLDPSQWLALDPAALPGVGLAHQGMALVRWGKDRVCLEALDLAAQDLQKRGEGGRSWRIVVRWAGERDRGAALRTSDLRQELACSIEPAPR